jgi:hypothetical protein
MPVLVLHLSGKAKTVFSLLALYTKQNPNLKIADIRKEQVYEG